VDDDDWVPIEFPPNLMEMMEAWLTTDEPNVGWCFLCNRPIKCEDDLIPETNTHNCPEGRALEETHHSRVAAQSPTRPPKQRGRKGRKAKLPQPRHE
jgi:hypothetical protein